ncbi:MAG TPA: PA2169 family four-helix-bundle protein [Saprospiraceae bacterium]
MTNDKTVDVLNRLVEINNDRIEGYETASDETNEQDLKALFARFAQNSHKCREELSVEIISLDGTPTDGTKNTGKLFRAWMDVKAALTGEDRHAILSSCEFGEDHALQTYRNVLKDDSEHLSSSQISMINTQMVLLKGDHDKVKAMRDAAKVEA